MIKQIQAGDVFAVVEQRAPTEPYWTLVRRYRVPSETDFNKLFGDGDGSIQSKGKPDNVSALTDEWIVDIKKQKAVKTEHLRMEFTCVTQGTVAKVVGGVSDVLLAGGDDDCVSAYFGLNTEWYDNSRASTYRLVAWRMVDG